MDRLDRGQLVEAIGVAPGEEAMTGALVRGAGLSLLIEPKKLAKRFAPRGPRSATSAGTTIGRPNVAVWSTPAAFGRGTGNSEHGLRWRQNCGHSLRAIPARQPALIGKSKPR